MQTPKFLRDLLQSNKYWNKNSAEFAKANEYLEKLFPGELQQDATGQYIEPKYDMTYEQFLDAQKKFDYDIQNAIQEAEAEAEAENDILVDYSQFVEIDEEIDVRVLMPWGDIQNEKLIVYTLNIPDDDDEEHTEAKKIWIWHSEDDERICDDCASHNGEVFEDKNDIPDVPVHPNCRCWVEEITFDEKGKTISSKKFEVAQQKAIGNQNVNNVHDTKEPTFAKPINTEKGMFAKFDGKSLTIYRDDKAIYAFDAVSGKPGFQTSEYQNMKSTGPIPEGTYVARQSELQNITPYGLIAGITNGGTWPGSLYSWGSSRIWLEPSKETNTYGRDNFSIHGGWNLGAAGCIDLTGQINMFTSWFESTGKDLLLYVEY